MKLVLNNLRRTVSFRLTAWYSGVFVASLLTLFAIIYLALQTSLRNSDRELIAAEMHELTSGFRIGGVDEIKKLAADKRLGSFFVRVLDANARTVFLSTPEPFSKVQLRALNTFSDRSPSRWFDLRIRPGNVFEITTVRLGDGSLLQVGRSTSHREEVLARLRRISVLVILPMLVIGLAGGAFLANRALRPIRQLSDTVRAIVETGKIQTRVTAPEGAGELRDLAISFNQMLERVDALLNAMRGALDNVAHDLRTPITSLRGIAELALTQPLNTKMSQEALADCIEESERVIRMLNTLMDISEVETGSMKLHLERVKMAALTEDVADIYRHVAEEKRILLAISVPDDLTLVADHNRLQQALANLVDNAIKYTPEDGSVRIEAEEEKGDLVLSVSDTGIGIAPEEQPRVWERLYRSDASRSQRGLGLGLSMVKAVVQAHKGRVEIQSSTGAGSTFRLHFPINGTHAADANPA